jgi:predicted GIY-YIG superfamily endonuclease
MGYMYILQCSDGSYYTGSTKDLERRILEHQSGEGANYTRKKCPVVLVYYEEYSRIDDAFYREKQVQGWSHVKKQALIDGKIDDLYLLSGCKNITHCKNKDSRSLSAAETTMMTLPSTPLREQKRLGH